MTAGLVIGNHSDQDTASRNRVSDVTVTSRLVVSAHKNIELLQKPSQRKVIENIGKNQHWQEVEARITIDDEWLSTNTFHEVDWPILI